MSRFQQKISAFFLALFAFAAAFGAAAQAQDRSKETLTIGISQFPTTFNPLIDAMAAKSYVLGFVHRPLTVYDPDWKLVCMMCETVPSFENGRAKLETLENGQTGIAVSFSIRPDAKWGDGAPITSADALFTWEVGRHPKSGVVNGELFRRILSVEILDDKNFVLHFDRVGYDYAAINDFQLLPAHLERKAFENPEQYRHQSLYEADPANPGLYAGPYRIAKVARGQYVLLEKNSFWSGRAPAFERIVIRAVESSPALEANLLSKDIDMIAGEVGLTLDAAMAFEKKSRPEWRVMVKSGLNFEHITLNFDNPALADKRVRQALLYGFDREGLLKALYDGRQPVAHSIVNPLDWMYDPDLRRYPYDLDRAAALLDEAGFAKDPGDGIRRGADGEKLSVEIMTTAGARNRETIQLAARQDWAKLGVETRIRNQPPRLFFGETTQRRLFSSMALFAWISAPDSVPRSIYHSDQIPTSDNHYAGQNVGGYRNPELDRLLDQVETELDREKRRLLWREIQVILAEELPDLPLTFRSDSWILPVWLEGVVPTGHQYPSSLWVEEWSVVP